MFKNQGNMLDSNIKIIAVTLLFSVIFFSLKYFFDNPKNRLLKVAHNTCDNCVCDYKVGDKKILKFIRSYNDHDKGKYVSVVILEGLEKGKTTVRVKCVDNSSGSIVNNDVLYIKVDKDGHATLEKNN